MKKLFIISVFFFLYIIVNAKQVEEKTAKLAGKNFLSSLINDSNINFDLTLVYKSSQKDSFLISGSQHICYFYIFNCINRMGFVIVSADNIVLPILGYSTENYFNANNIPANLSWWLQNYSDQIQFTINNNFPPSLKIYQDWKDLICGKYKKPLAKSGVEPLLKKITWNQSPYYNDLCPDNNTGIHAMTGCAATAMAQIMKYWEYPIKGTGEHSYIDPINIEDYNQIPGSAYGFQTANFGNTTYKWDDMPDNVTYPNDAVAKLMYHCGVSIDMDFGPSWSGACVLKRDGGNASCEYALPTYFGYKSSISGILRSDYINDANWISDLKKELDSGRPIQYAGWSNNQKIGHTWVCDGYNSNDYFHMNWGWGNINANEYYTINLVNDNISQIYTTKQQALIGIEPAFGQCSYSLSQNSNKFSTIGGTGSFKVLTSTNCSWTVQSNNSWIRITSGLNGQGNGIVSYSVDPNGTLNTLTGSITITGGTNNLTYDITESGNNCSYTLIPSFLTHSALGGSGNFSINTSNNCVWSLISNNPSWLHITSNPTGIGSATISYFVDPNLTTNTLTGSITIANQTFNVIVSGAAFDCNVSFIPADIMFIGKYQGNYSFVYNINSGCSYSTLSSSPDWLIISSALNNVIHFNVSTNSSYFPRTGYIYLNGIYKQVTQEGNTSLEINEVSQLNDIKIYPNPITDKFTIELDYHNSSYSLEILNTIGQVILIRKITNNIEQIDLSGLSDGIYFVKLQSENNKIVRKIIKQTHTY